MNRRANTFIRQLGSSTGLGYGRLYNWHAANNSKLAPTDWIVPSISNLTTLFSYLGGDSVAAGHLKEIGTDHWDSPNIGADNSSNFTAWAGGWRRSDNGLFEHIKTIGVFWSQTSIYYMGLVNASAAITYGIVPERYGFSIRLLYTGVGTPTIMTDYDGNVYDVIQIGTQYWTKQNWKCTKLNDGTPIPEVTDNATWAGLTTWAWCYYNNYSGNL